MIIAERHIEYCLQRANEIADHFALFCPVTSQAERSVDYLKRTCEDFLKTKINLIQLDIQADDSSVLGACIKNPDSFDIVFVQGLNYCWTRFVVCKELFHAVLNEDEYKNMDLTGHVEEVTVKFPLADSEPGLSVVAEFLAEIAAMEFMFPYCWRLAALEGDGAVNFRAIAEMYKVPQVRVEQYLSKDFMDALREYSRLTTPSPKETEGTAK